MPVPIKQWTGSLEIEETAQKQLTNMASLDIIWPHIAIMPDVHWGCGATVGSVIPTLKAIIPAAVGVDIGCGMMAIRTTLKSKDLPDNLFELRSKIEAAVPHGRTDNGGSRDRGAWANVPMDYLQRFFKSRLYGALYYMTLAYNDFERAAMRAPSHLGTLGTGNHFIEVCLDEEQYVWVMLHSGSRGIGNRIGTYFIELAKKEMAINHPGLEIADQDLCYLDEGTNSFSDYVMAVDFAQQFALLNRELMMGATLEALRSVTKPFKTLEQAINCHHNYVQQEMHFDKQVWLTRKGAVCAEKDKLGIIPGSMGAKSFIVRGKGNPESFNSCSHGAGRSLSRNKAKQLFSLEDHALATEGVECRKDINVIDETPGAYKDIAKVMAAQLDLVDIVHTLKQVVCVKG
jgi:tRNA-splicing ligase RtcB